MDSPALETASFFKLLQNSWTDIDVGTITYDDAHYVNVASGVFVPLHKKSPVLSFIYDNVRDTNRLIGSQVRLMKMGTDLPVVRLEVGSQRLIEATTPSSLDVVCITYFPSQGATPPYLREQLKDKTFSPLYLAGLEKMFRHADELFRKVHVCVRAKAKYQLEPGPIPVPGFDTSTR